MIDNHHILMVKFKRIYNMDKIVVVLQKVLQKSKKMYLQKVFSMLKLLSHSWFRKEKRKRHERSI